MPVLLAARLEAAPAVTLAAGKSAGGTAFLIVVLLIIIAIGLFAALSGSLKRLRSRVNDGTFGQPDESPSAPARSRVGARDEPEEAEEEPEQAPSSATPDRSRRDAGDA